MKQQFKLFLVSPFRAREVRDHTFFKNLDWKLVELLKVRSPTVKVSIFFELNGNLLKTFFVCEIKCKSEKQAYLYPVINSQSKLTINKP